MPRLRFAGQITGVEGYVESAAIGLLAGRFAAAERRGESLAPPPPTTALGALLEHITGGADARSFQPMNVNFGLFPPLPQRCGAAARRRAQAAAGAPRARRSASLAGRRGAGAAGYRSALSRRRWRPSASKLAGSSQRSNACFSAGHSPSMIENQTVSRLRPL